MVFLVARHIFPLAPETDEVKWAMLRDYLEQKHELEGGSADDVTPEEMELWFASMRITDVVGQDS